MEVDKKFKSQTTEAPLIKTTTIKNNTIVDTSKHFMKHNQTTILIRIAKFNYQDHKNNITLHYKLISFL